MLRWRPKRGAWKVELSEGNSLGSGRRADFMMLERYHKDLVRLG